MKQKYIVGYDVGGTKCAVVLASVVGGIRILDKIKFATQANLGYEQTKEHLFAATHELLARNHLNAEQLEAIGVSCGGPLDSKRGVVLCPPHLPGWVNIPICRLISEEFGVPAFLQNDANACALVEWKLGAGRGTENMMFLTMGTGFGGGMICEGRLLCGANDMGGEIGHLRLAPEGPVGFGKAGSVEGFCSGAGIGTLAQQFTRKKTAEGAIPAWVCDGISAEAVDAKIMAEYAHNGDDMAKEFYAQIGTYLGNAVSLLVDSFNPERVVIGSIFVRCEDLLRPTMEEALKKECISYSLEACRVVPAQTGEQIGDLASILTACYGLNLDIEPYEYPQKEEVLFHYRRMTERYPQLSDTAEKVMQAYQLLERCYRNGNKLLLCGNGGSASDCAHIVGELMKGFYKKRPLGEKYANIPAELRQGLQGALTAIDLTQHTSLSTAYLNDIDPQMSFAQQVLGFGRPGDVLLGISTSGNSQNVKKAMQVAHGLGMSVIGLTGEGGGAMAERCDILIDVPAKRTADVQELHLPVYHTLCAMLEATFFEE